MGIPSRLQLEAPDLVRRASLSGSLVTPTAVSGTTTSSNSFIGNTPSTVLFFIALAVGVCIALLFIYFTLRYFVKTKFGVYIPSSFGIGQTMAGRGAAGRYAFTGGISNFHNFNDFADYALHRDYNALLAVRERRLQGRRYRKKRKLTQDEVDELFPTKTYNNWVNGGKEDDLKRQKGLILHENDLENINQEVEAEQEDLNKQLGSNEIGSSGKNEVSVHETDITDLMASSSKTIAVEEVEDSQLHNIEDGVDIGNIDDGLHFSSGMCAICLDTLEDEDIVRGLICGHVFHQDCIDPWLINRKACCPMCKRDYYMKDHTNGEGEDGEDGIDGESLMPLESIADFVLPRPIAYRARELLDAYDALNTESGQNRNNNDNNANSNDENTVHNGGGADENNENNRHNQNSHNVAVQDLVGIRELALEKLPSYYNWTNKLFWRIMGITKQNLTDYLIVKIYEERRRDRFSRENEQTNRTSFAEGTSAVDEIEMQEVPSASRDSQGLQHGSQDYIRRAQMENIV